MNRPTLLIIGVALIAAGVYYFTATDSSPAQVESDASGKAAQREIPEAATATTASYTLDAERSTLGWAAERIVGNSHKGTVDIASGSMTVETGVVTEGAFTVDMTSITESNDTQLFLKHIASDDFFSVEAHPTAMFVITEAVPVSGDGDIVNYRVTGDMTIRGITNEVTFDATAELADDGMRVTSEFRIDRTRWDIVYDSGSIFLQLGDKAIRDEITFNLDLAFRVAADAAMEDDAS